MPLSNASRLADFGTGIGTAGAIIQVDNVNQRLGVGTTAPTATLGVAGIVSATAFYGDGSNLDGVASAGLGTALSEEEFNPLTVIYQTSDTLSVGATITVDPPDATTKVAYTQYAEVKLEGDADLIIADGDDFIPDILGLSTEGFSFSNANGNGIFDTVYTDNIENAAGRGAPNFPLGITVSGISTLSGNVSIGGTLTYEDVTNVDSIGVVTARSGVDINAGGLDVTAGGINVTAGGINVTAGISTFGSNVKISASTPDSLLHIGKGTNADDGAVTFTIGGSSINTRQSTITKNNVGSNDRALEIRAATGNSHETIKLFSDNTTERIRIGQSGQIGIGGANYGTSGQVLTSQGGSAAPQWSSPSGGLSMVDWWYLRPPTSSSVTANYGEVILGDWSATSNLMKWIRYEEQYGITHVGAAMTVSSSGEWTFPSTGIYQVDSRVFFPSINNGNRTRRCQIQTTIDNGSSWTSMAQGNITIYGSAMTAANVFLHSFNVTNTSTHRVRLKFHGENDSYTSYTSGSDGANYYGLERNMRFQKID